MEHGIGIVHNPRDFTTIRLPRHRAKTIHFCSNLVSAVFFFSFFPSLCVFVKACPIFPDGNWKFDLYLISFPSCYLLLSHHAYRQDYQAHKGLGAFVRACVCMHECVCVHVCLLASVNPFCQVLVQPFLSKLPA